jgi:hypothetical protein
MGDVQGTLISPDFNQSGTVEARPERFHAAISIDVRHVVPIHLALIAETLQGCEPAIRRSE